MVRLARQHLVLLLPEAPVPLSLVREAPWRRLEELRRQAALPEGLLKVRLEELRREHQRHQVHLGRLVRLRLDRRELRCQVRLW